MTGIAAKITKEGTKSDGAGSRGYPGDALHFSRHVSIR